MTKLDIDAALKGTKYDDDSVKSTTLFGIAAKSGGMVEPDGYTRKGTLHAIADARTNAALVEVLAKALEGLRIAYVDLCESNGVDYHKWMASWNAAALEALAQYKERDAK